MTDEQVSALGWDTKLPVSLDASLDALDIAIESHALDNLGVEFLKMYAAFKRLEVKQASENTEEKRQDLFAKIF